MLRSGAVLLFTLVISAIPVYSQTPDLTFFNGLRYRLVGPARGGRVTTVTGVPSQPKTFYMGIASGGLFRTTDNGATWTPITDGKVPLGSMGDVAVANSDPNIIYLGTGSMACAVMSQPVAACTSQLTADKRGNLSVFITPDRSERFAFIQQIPTSCGWRRAATSSSRTKSAAYSKQLTAGRRGAKFYTFQTALARWTSRYNPAIHQLFMRGCRASSASRGPSSADRATVVFTRALTVANAFRRSLPGFQPS